MKATDMKVCDSRHAKRVEGIKAIALDDLVPGPKIFHIATNDIKFNRAMLI